MVGQDGPRWLSLGEAARFLGVDVTTLRGWADAGKVPAFRTPGGHRRFDPAHLEALVKASAGQPAGRSPELAWGTIAPRAWLVSQPWYAGIDESGLARVRGHCAELMRIVTSYMGGEPAHPRHLAAARRVGAALGQEVAGWGLTPAQSIEVFLYFKLHVTEALAAPHEGGAAGQLRSMRDADAFLGGVLQAMMEAYGASRA
jgi:excisionase family DNA binding protein